MKANARDIRTALERASPDYRLYLLYGPDASTAAELAGLLGTAMGADAERVDLDGAALKSDPARLADEAASMSLFGGARYIRVSGIGEESAEAIATLLAADRAGNPVVAIAPTAKATGKIVKLAIDSRAALAFACYEPSTADAERIAAGIARDHGLRATNDAARRIAAAAGNDRAIMLREIEKLALFLDAAPDRPVDLDDLAIDAVGADLGEAEQTRLVEAFIDGHSAIVGQELDRAAEAGTSPIPWLRAIARRLLALAEMRSDIDAGGAVDAVLKRHRVFFREEAATTRALRRWSAPMLARAFDRVRQAERDVMAPGNAGTILADRTVAEVARGVERRG